MTPIEKAKYLRDEFIDYVDGTNMFESYELSIAKKNAKQCALVTVDEMISEFNTIDPEKVSELVTNHVSYWQEVKQEIENL